MNEIVVNGPNGVTIRFPAGTDPATIDRVMREATGMAPAAAPAGTPVDLTRAANPPPVAPAPFADPATGQITPEARATPLLDQIANPGTVGANAAMPAPGQIGSPYQIPQDDLGDLGFAPPRVAPGNPAERAFELGLQGVGAGVADVAGMPVDLSNAFLNILYSGVNRLAGREVIPLQDRPFGGSQTIRDTAATIAEPLGLETLDREEMTPQERLGYDATRTGTGAVVGAGGLARVGAAVRPAVIPAAQTAPLPRTLDALIQPYAVTPGRAFAGDAAAGVGAGTANFAYEEMVPEAMQERFGPLGNVLANIAGGVGGATTLAVGEGIARGATGAAASAVRGPLATDAPLSPTGAPYRRADLTDAATIVQGRANGWGQTGDYASRAAAAEIEGMQNRLGQYSGPGSLPTSGISSNNPGLIALEQRTRAQMPADFVRRDNATRQAAVDTAAQIAPAAATGRQFTDEVAAIDADRVAGAAYLRDEAQTQLRQAEAAGVSEAAPVAVEFPLRRREEAALGIDRAVVDETMRPMQDASGKLFAGVDPDRVAMIDASGVVDAAERVRNSAGALVDPASVLPAGLLTRIKKLEGEVDPEEGGVAAMLGADETPPAEVAVGDIVAVFPEINRAVDAARRAGNMQLADNLQALRDGLNDAIDTAAAEGNDAAIRAVAARENWQETLGTTFGRDQPTAYDLRRNVNLARGSRAESPPSQTAGQFLRTGQPERAVELQNILARSKDPAAGQQAVRDYLMADLAASGVRDANGFLRPDTLRRWRDKWGAALDTSPETAVMVDDLIARAGAGETLRADLAVGLRAAEDQLTQVQRDKGAFAFVLGNNPENAVNAIFNGGDPEMAVRQILDQIGTNQSALDGFKASVREYMQTRMTTSAVNATTEGASPLAFGKLDQLFKRHEETLSQIFSPEEMGHLQAAREFLRPLNNLRNGALPGSQTAERGTQQFWNLLEVGLKARYGILKGGGLLRTIRLWAKTLPNNETAVGQIMTDMLFNPDLAKHLLRAPLREVGTPRYNSALNRLLGYAEGSREDQERRQNLAPSVEN